MIQVRHDSGLSKRLQGVHQAQAVRPARNSNHHAISGLDSTVLTERRRDVVKHGISRKPGEHRGPQDWYSSTRTPPVDSGCTKA